MAFNSRQQQNAPIPARRLLDAADVVLAVVGARPRGVSLIDLWDPSTRDALPGDYTPWEYSQAILFLFRLGALVPTDGPAPTPGSQHRR